MHSPFYKPFMQIVLIGSGNAATALGHLCHRGGHKIVQVFGRNKISVDALAKTIEAAPVYQWSEITHEAELYIVSLPDSVVPTLHENFSLQKGMVVHTAGAVPMQALSKVARNYGVLYPLQSLHKNVIEYSNIPLLVDGNTPEDKTLIADFAATLSGKVAYATDEERIKLHVAAVWVNNFANHLYTIAWDFCHENQLDYFLLLPMMETTVNRQYHGKPSDFQTGPAIRGDQATIVKHLSLMEGNPEWQELYQTLTDEIARYYKK
jgi:predicted short-subunit dehydrogenase-like oxidoreductase (DUF2520 family)